MQLVPVYADDEAATGGVKVSPSMQQNLGLRTAVVRRAAVAASFDAVGTVQFDERLVVPAEAVIRTGTRTVAIVRTDGGGFAPRELQLGASLGDDVEVLGGLAEGEQVVASGQFLIDSEARLKSTLGALAGSAP